MARCCGSTGTCACKVEAGRMVSITGTGTSQDPFVIASDVSLSVEDNETFDIGLFGTGTLDSPWLLQVQFKDTATLGDVPDVNAGTSITNGYVLTWDETNQQWAPAPGATADPGAVLAGDGLTGDGSGGDPLVAVGEDARYIQVSVDGIGLTDVGINRLVRVFASEAARDAADPPVDTGALTILTSSPTLLWYYDGADYISVNGGVGLDIQPGQLLALSGSYAGGETVRYVAQLSETTDGSGAFEVIPSADLSTYSGVLSVRVQPVGLTPWHCIVQAGVNNITGVAYRIDTGAAYTGVGITAVVEALLYT